MGAGIYIIKCICLIVCLLSSGYVVRLAENKKLVAGAACCFGMCIMAFIYTWLVEGTWVI